MGSPSARLIQRLWAFRRKIAERYEIRRMILFGSRARGRARRDSDVDLLLVSPKFRRKNAVLLYGTGCSGGGAGGAFDSFLRRHA